MSTDATFELDDEKRKINYEKHGLDFLDCFELFDGRSRLDVGSPREGEQRIISICKFRERYVTLVWTPRNEAIRLISFGRSREAEKRRYAQIFGE